MCRPQSFYMLPGLINPTHLDNKSRRKFPEINFAESNCRNGYARIEMRAGVQAHYIKIPCSVTRAASQSRLRHAQLQSTVTTEKRGFVGLRKTDSGKYRFEMSFVERTDQRRGRQRCSDVSWTFVSRRRNALPVLRLEKAGCFLVRRNVTEKRSAREKRTKTRGCVTDALLACTRNCGFSPA